MDEKRSKDEQARDVSFLEAFEEPRRSRAATLAIWIVIVAVASLIILRQGKSRHHPTMSPEQEQRFAARFDSLCKVSLYPVVWRSGTFVHSRFEGNFEKWTLTISSRDWQLRDEAARKDLVALIWNAYRATREQAGGDPDNAMLVIDDENGNVLAEATPTSITVH